MAYSEMELEHLSHCLLYLKVLRDVGVKTFKSDELILTSSCNSTLPTNSSTCKTPTRNVSYQTYDPKNGKVCPVNIINSEPF